MIWSWSFFVAIIGISVATESEDTKPKLWALLVSGSNGWYNYRHQADVCHAYQILHRHGIPDENIVVMMYDDLAHNEENPTPGIVINHPKGHDVYTGVPKDYTKELVTPQNFLNILAGKKAALNNTGSGKIINSGPNDHVFVNFVDHGAPGILAFPDGTDPLTAKDFLATLTQMHKAKRYKKMVIYVEACESGSMFKGLLPPNIDIYATTAANDEESSYACYYDKKRNTYLGDLYSVNWMEDSDRENIEVETLLKQYQVTKQETNTSHVEEFGDLTLAKMPVGEFQGEKRADPIIYKKVPYDAIPSHEVPLSIMYKKLSFGKNEDEKTQQLALIKATLAKRQFLTSVMGHLVKKISNGEEQEQRILTMRRKITDFDCHDVVVKIFDRFCFKFSSNPFAMRFVYQLVNMCEEKIPVEKIVENIESVCEHDLHFGIL